MVCEHLGIWVACEIILSSPGTGCTFLFPFPIPIPNPIPSPSRLTILKIHFKSVFCFCRDTISKESAASVPGWVQDLFYLTAVLNSCINPVVYGHYYHGERRRRTESSRTVMSEVNGRTSGDRQIRMKRLQWNREDRVRITINNNSSELIWV